MRYLHTMVRVRDLDESLAFYCDKLGLKEVSRMENEAGRFTLVFLCAPGDEAAAYNLGNSLKALGKTDKALEVYRYALKRQQSGGGGGGGGANPREPATHANIGYTLDAAGRYGEAIGAFQASLALLPSDASVHTGLGHALKSKGDMSAAADAYRKALSIEPTASAAASSSEDKHTGPVVASSTFHPLKGSWAWFKETYPRLSSGSSAADAPPVECLQRPGQVG